MVPDIKKKTLDDVSTWIRSAGNEPVFDLDT